ncbi:MAG: response regulator [Oscillatoriales cyanobacterium C42_A2020_001]|nr:response regulator [Leptolyngbyaceae cyanobacterium C42_A2020_001]
MAIALPSQIKTGYSSHWSGLANKHDSKQITAVYPRSPTMKLSAKPQTQTAPSITPWQHLCSLANQIRLGLLAMVLLSVLPLGTTLIYWSWIHYSEQTRQLQEERSRLVAGHITNYLDDLQRKLSYLARIKGLSRLAPATQQTLIEGLTRHNDAYEVVAVLDRRGQVISSASPYQKAVQKNFAKSALFQRAYRQQEEFVGTVAINPQTHTPMVTMAVPIRDQADRVDGVLLAQVNLSFLQYVVSQTQVGTTGYVYVVDERNYLIARSDAKQSQVKLEDLRDRPLIRTLNQLEKDNLFQYQGLQNLPVLGAVAPVRSVSWKVAVELPMQEANAPLYRMAMIMGGAAVGLLALAIASGWLFSRRLTNPLKQLTQAAIQLSKGDLNTRVSIPTQNELGLLAQTFNHMAEQVQASVRTLENANEELEQRVAARIAELQAAKEAADMANRAKSEFLANMNHELRTPLNGILGYAQIFSRDTTFTPKQQQGIEVIYQCGSHLLTLINDILDLAKIEARKMELYPQDFHFPNFLADTTEICSIKARQKGIQFTYVASGDLPTAVHTDDKRLRQVLLNLLSNAIKFTDHGQVTFRVTAVHEFPTADASMQLGDGLSERVRFTVQDTGIGIPPEKLNAVFSAFEQVGGRDRNSEGTGLGLAISQQIVQMMGGEITVQSTVGQGSTFEFELNIPLANDWQYSAAGDRAPLVIGYRGKPYTILVVDDHPENRLVLINMLEPLGFQIIEASDGQAGYETALKCHPDLIITDVIMPELTGLEMTTQLRQHPEFAEIPIIASPASLSQVERHESFEAGCNSFFPKPIQFDALLLELAQFLELQWVYDTDQPSPAATAEPVQAEDNGFVIPPQEELIALYNAAQGGFIQDIQQEAMRIRELTPNYSEFANRILDLAHDFDDEAILQLVKPYM